MSKCPPQHKLLCIKQLKPIQYLLVDIKHLNVILQSIVTTHEYYKSFSSCQKQQNEVFTCFTKTPITPCQEIRVLNTFGLKINL